MHEASRRLLGVLLREIDGFNHRDTAGSSSDGGGGDSSKRSVVIGATNRQQDLDAALLSRYAGSAAAAGFGLNGTDCCSQIECSLWLNIVRSANFPLLSVGLTRQESQWNSPPQQYWLHTTNVCSVGDATTHCTVHQHY
jgi:hypothetical protein